MKIEYQVVICFGITLLILGWLIYSHLDKPKLPALLIMMSILIITTSFVVFGKDLFKATKKPNSDSSGRSA